MIASRWADALPLLMLLPVIFFTVPTVGLILAQRDIFLVGMATIAQFSFWGNYLPRVYPTHLRGTGESFTAKIGTEAYPGGFIASFWLPDPKQSSLPD